MRSLLNAALVITALILLGGGCGGSTKKPLIYDPTNPVNRTADAALLFTMINDMRANASQTALTVDPLITVAAAGYANFFAYYWSNNGMQPYVDDLDGLLPTDRLTNAGVSFVSCDETGMAEMDWRDAAYVINSLDPAKLVDPGFTRIGIAAVGVSCQQ